MNIPKLSSILAALAMAVTFNTAQAKGQCDNQDIIDLPFGESGVSGSATMCATPGGLKAQIRVQGLVPDNAYTMWWVYFDNQSGNDTECEGGFPDEAVCGFPDFGSENPVAVFGRLGSVVAPRNGNAHFGDELSGMQASSGSEVWLLMFGHGAANMTDGRQLARQLLTPEDPNAGFPHLGVNPYGYPVGVAVYTVD
jgi:hypothetical protein